MAIITPSIITQSTGNFVSWLFVMVILNYHYVWVCYKTDYCIIGMFILIFIHLQNILQALLIFDKNNLRSFL
jgi:hypothetical protein